MKKFKLKQVTMALSASSVLLASGMFSPPAHALRDLLFPYITTETGKFTFITILNDGSTPGPVAAGLHFTYGMKPVPVVAKAGCQHFDSDVNTTLGDMMIFEVNAKVTEPGGALFEGGSTPPVTSSPLTYPIAGQQGFLIVNQPVGNDAFLFGWASVVDSASGLTWTYSTSGLTKGDSGTASASADFSPIDGSDLKFTSWYPQTIVPTNWLVVPLGTRDAMSPVAGGGIRRGITATVDHTIAGVATSGTAGAFDLDEQFISGGRNVPIRCFGYMSRADILQPATDAATAAGGWLATIGTSLTLAPADAVDPGGSYSTGPYLLFKIQTTTALGAAKTTINREPSHNDFDGITLTP